MVSGNAIAIRAYQHSISKPKMVERIMAGGVGRPGAPHSIPLADDN